MDKQERDELQAIFDQRYVLRDDCDDKHDKLNEKVNISDKKLAVIEYQQKINNWLSAAIAGGVVALVIKIYLGG